LSIDHPDGCPQHGIHVDRMKSVQKNFLLFALWSLNWDAKQILPSYFNRLLIINLPPLAKSRTMFGTIFINNLIHGENG